MLSTGPVDLNNYLRVDGANMMLGNLNMNSHEINQVTQMNNSIGPSNFYIALGPSLDLASDSSINLISALPVSITSANLDMNGNSIVNAPNISCSGDMTLSPTVGNVILPTGQINCSTTNNFGLYASGPNGVNQILFNYDDTAGEYVLINSADIQAIFIDPWYSNPGGAPSEPLQ